MKKYPTPLLAYLVNYVGLAEEEINSMTRHDVFIALLTYKGYGVYAGSTIRTMVKNIYGIDLASYEEYFDPVNVAEMDGLDEHK